MSNFKVGDNVIITWGQIAGKVGKVAKFLGATRQADIDFGDGRIDTCAIDMLALIDNIMKAPARATRFSVYCPKPGCMAQNSSYAMPKIVKCEDCGTVIEVTHLEPEVEYA